MKRFFGWDEYSAETENKAEVLRVQIDAINARLAELDSQQARIEKSSPFSRLIQGAREFVTHGLDYIKEGWERIQDAAAEAHLRQIEAQAVRRAQLGLTAREAASVTELSRLQMQLAGMRIPGLGMLGAVPELNAFLRQTDRQLEALQKLLESIDTATSEGRQESNRIRAEILGLRIERKQATIQLQQAILDQTMNEALNTGRFSKVIISANNGLLRGLQAGIVKQTPFSGRAGVFSPVLPFRLSGKFDKDFAAINQRVDQIRNVQVQEAQRMEVKADQLQLTVPAVLSLPEVSRAPVPKAGSSGNEERDLANRLGECAAIQERIARKAERKPKQEHSYIYNRSPGVSNF